MTNKNILLITNKDDITTDFIVQRIKQQGHRFYRFNTEEIGNTLQICLDFLNNNYLIYDVVKNSSVNLLDFDSVYFRRPEIGLYVDSLSEGETAFAKGEVLFTLEGIYKILRDKRWLNHVDDIRRAENKVFQLLLAQEIGFRIPDSIITNRPDSAHDFGLDKDGTLIIKPIKSGLVEGVKEEGVIFTNRIEINNFNKDRISSFPVYLQSEIKKEADVRVTVVGSEIFAALIHSQSEKDAIVDWRRSESILEYSKIELPSDVHAKCIELIRKLHLNFGAIDLVLEPSGTFVFLEINPNGQWGWIEKQLNYNISDEIVSFLAEE